MKISTKGRYALRMMLDMAQNQKNGPVALKDIAEQLSQAGVIRGSRGHQGGYRMLAEPKDCTVYDILECVEGSMHPVTCLDHTPNDCERCNGCETLYVWQGLDVVIQDYLKGITLQDVLDKMAEKK